MVIKKDSAKVKELKHKSRRYSIKEGIFASAKNAFGHSYLSPFAIAINASNSAVILLSSITSLLGPLSQIYGSKLIEKYSRKKIIIKSVFLEALAWIPFIIIGFLFYKGILTNSLPFFLLLFFAFYTIISNLGHSAWFSWMGDIVDEKYRGRWFSKRNLIMGFVLTLLTIIAAIFLDYAKKTEMLMFGFLILFFLAFIARLICWKTFKKQYEPKIKLKKGYYFSFSDFIKNAKNNNFGQFSIFRALLSFACFISAPFLVIYLLRNLQFSYLTYMIIIFSGTIFSLFVLKFWGKISDKYGNYKILILTSIAIPTIPLLWILNTSPIYLILVPSIIGAVAWAGFNLASGNFIYDNVSVQKRGLAVSYYNMLHGIGAFLGSIIGILLMKIIIINSTEQIMLIFLIGGIARMVIVSTFIKKIKEVRKTAKFDSTKSIKNLMVKEYKSTLIEEAHEIMAIKEYIKEK